MRIAAYILIALGIYCLASTAYDEYRGETHKPYVLVGRTRGRHDGYLYSIPVLRQNSPELFHQFMTTHWIYAALISGIGCALYLGSGRSQTE
jgi:hypothetical protein